MKIKYNGSSDSNQLRSRGAVFNIPVSAEDYSGRDVLAIKTSTRYDKASKTFKSFDYSTYINDSSPYKKFHQVTLYLGNNVLTANLPKNITYKISNQYGKPLDWTANATLNWLSQSFSGVIQNATGGALGGSMIPRASTAQIWTGTDPLTISFTIDVIDDVQTNSSVNFQECLQILGKYALPSNGGMMYTDVPFGANLSVSYNDKNTGTHRFGGGQGKHISVLFGGMLYCEYMALKSFSVTYENTKNMLLHDYSMAGKGGSRLLPMTAKIQIELMTVEGLTKDTYTKMLMMNGPLPDTEHQSSGNFNVDITGLRNFVMGSSSE